MQKLDITILKQLAEQAQLDLVGAVPAGPAPGMERYRTWLEQGYAGEMAYLTRPDALEKRADPRRILPETKSILVVAASYPNSAPATLAPLHGRVSRYAWGEDYHRWLLRRLKALLQSMQPHCGDFKQRSYVDTGPILERAWAHAAGLGWFGKNGMLIHPQIGSYLFLGVALVAAELPRSKAPAHPSCGSCTRCIDACPTQAIVAPGVIDARRCLAYLSIEHRGSIPQALRGKLGESVFGCDICQEVCPWNQRAQLKNPAPPSTFVDNSSLFLPELLTLSDAEFRARFRRSPIWRATPAGLARNAAIVLGNRRDPAAAPYLGQAATQYPNASVREHAEWALRQLATPFP